MTEIPITEANREDILTGKICPYCGRRTILADSKLLYNGISYGMVYLCKPCYAFVGCHKGTTKALGRLADMALRTAKKEAHAWFDPIWQRAMGDGLSKMDARHAAYKWLSETLCIDFAHTHIGMFNLQQCAEVVTLCKQKYKLLK